MSKLDVLLCMMIVLRHGDGLQGGEEEDDYFKRIVSLDNRKYETGILRHIVGKSSIHCGKKCMEEEECKSYLFNSKARYCTLSDVIVLELAGTIQETGWRYFVLQSSNEATTVPVETTTKLVTTELTTTILTTKEAVTTTVLTTIAGITCPSDYYILPTTNVCLKYHDASGWTSTLQRQAACASDGARLLRVENAVTQVKLTEYLTTFISNTDLRIVIQGEEDGPGGTWKFDDGTAISYLPWKPGQPNNVDHNCIALRPMEFSWVDIDCGRDEPVICEVVTS